MYCPNCKQSFDGKFCPECGAKLIEEPSAGGFGGIHLGDANAISGGINISNNIVERNKSDEELLLERKNRYRSLCRQYLADGRIDESERLMLDGLAGELGLDKETQDEILTNEIAVSRKRSTGLDKASKVVFIQIIKKLRSFDLPGIVTLYPKLQNVECSFNDAPVKFYYFLISSVLRPTECIRRFESHQEDNYWLTYWCVMSYLLKGANNKAEQTKILLSNWSEYNEENSLLLDIAISIKTGDYETAEVYRDVLEGSYSEELADFATSLFTLLDNVDALNTIKPESQTAFYLDGMFYKELEKKSLGILQPDGTLGEGVVTANEPVKPRGPIVGSAPLKEEKKKEEKKKEGIVAMKDVVTKPLSKEECDRLVDRGIYNKLDKQDDGLFIIEAENEDGEDVYGLWDRSKECLILDVIYQSVWNAFDDVYCYKIKSDYGTGFVCVKSLKRTIDDDNDGIYQNPYNSDLVEVQKKGKNGRVAYGFIDTQNNTYALRPECEKIEDSDYKIVKGYCLVKDFSDNWGIFSCEGKDLVVECRYKDIRVDHQSKLYYWLITNLVNIDKNPDVFVLGADILYTRTNGGVSLHELFNHILIIHKSAEGSYAVCNCNRKDNEIVYYDDIVECWYDDATDEEQITPLILVEKDSKWGVLDAETGSLILNLDYDDAEPDGIEGSPCIIFKRDGQEYTFNMFTRQFE